MRKKEDQNGNLFRCVDAASAPSQHLFIAARLVDKNESQQERKKEREKDRRVSLRS